MRLAKIAVFGTFLFLCTFNLKAQNPFKKYGYNPKVLTLSDGKFAEHIQNDTLMEVGSVVYNMVTKKVVGFITKDTLYSEATGQPEVVSRWISPDPLAHKYPQVSPYNYVMNNPLIYIDPDGRDWFYYQSKGEKERSWHWQEGEKATYTNTKGKEVTTSKGYDYLVTYKITGKNSEGALTGNLQVWGDRNPNKGALLTVKGSFTGNSNYNFKPTEEGNYMMDLSKRDSKGPQAMNAAKDNPVAYMGIQLMPNRYLIEGNKRYDIGGAYGGGRIRLLQTDYNLNIDQRNDHGYYIHGKYESHNWTHGCICDKSESVFNYFWSGAGKNIRGYVPVSVEY